MFEVFASAVKGGFRTSEFWLAVIAVVLPQVDGLASSLHGTAGVVASAVIAAAYSASRAYVKGQTIKETAPSAASEQAVQYMDSPLGARIRAGASDAAGAGK